jgi:hypothetical protein
MLFETLFGFSNVLAASLDGFKILLKYPKQQMTVPCRAGNKTIRARVIMKCVSVK